MKRITLLLLLSSLLLPAASALAQTADDLRARELYENGALLYEEGDYDNAVIAWKQAWDLSPDKPLLLFNIANALERIGEWEEAYDFLSRYRALAPADERDVLDRRLRAIERRVEERRAEAAAERAAADEEARVEAERVAAERGTDSQTGTGTAKPDGPHPAPIILLGAGLGGVAVGGVFGGLAIGERADAEALCAAYGEGLLCPEGARSHIDNDRSYSLASDISLIAGGVVAATGVVLAIVDAATAGKEARSVRIIPSAGPTGGAVVVLAEF